ncbi:hypothetical protein BDR26DRAFT_894860 [Obelidium mucronatum]|nr:hypothetical protein BDR26DRAFT_894860 [Obelidium mucronatum]
MKFIVDMEDKVVCTVVVEQLVAGRVCMAVAVGIVVVVVAAVVVGIVDTEIVEDTGLAGMAADVGGMVVGDILEVAEHTSVVAEENKLVEGKQAVVDMVDSENLGKVADKEMVACTVREVYILEMEDFAERWVFAGMSEYLRRWVGP